MSMDDYQNFLNDLQKRGSKPHRISHCLGARDAWKWVRKNKWQTLGGKPCPQSLYGEIINAVNWFLVEQLLDGHEVELPYQMGSLLIESQPAKVFMEDGELKNNYRTDWRKTLEYWYEDAEAKATHKTIKRVQNQIYYVNYLKRKAKFRNRRFYRFRPNRSLVKYVGHAVENGSIRGVKG